MHVHAHAQAKCLCTVQDGSRDRQMDDVPGQCTSLAVASAADGLHLPETKVAKLQTLPLGLQSFTKAMHDVSQDYSGGLKLQTLSLFSLGSGFGNPHRSYWGSYFKDSIGGVACVRFGLCMRCGGVLVCCCVPAICMGVHGGAAMATVKLGRSGDRVLVPPSAAAVGGVQMA